MDSDERNAKQRKLKELLECLSQELFDANKMENLADSANEIYSDGSFRHKYSDFLPIILEIDKDPNKSLDFLTNNLNDLYDFIIKTPKYCSISDQLFKLSDHINLEIARLNTYSEQNKKTIEELGKTTEQLAKAELKLKKATRKAKDLQTEVITVLSVFSAIVISFFGGINFIGNAIASAYATRIYKVVMIILISGIVLFNVVFLLLYMVSKIIERDVYAKCKTDDCSCNPKCNWIKRIYFRLPYVFGINVFLMALTVLDAVIWALNNI